MRATADQRIVQGIGVLLDLQVFPDEPFAIRQERPRDPEREAPFKEGQLFVHGNSSYSRVGDPDLRLHLGQPHVLAMVFRSVVSSRKDQAERIVRLDLGESPHHPVLVGQLVVREAGPGNDVRSHGQPQ